MSSLSPIPQKANDRQEGGSHYMDFGNLQPWDVAIHFRLSFLEGNIVKYILRYKYKNEDEERRLEDLKKARHYIDKLIEVQEKIVQDTA